MKEDDLTKTHNELVGRSSSFFLDFFGRAFEWTNYKTFDIKYWVIHLSVGRATGVNIHTHRHTHRIAYYCSGLASGPGLKKIKIDKNKDFFFALNVKHFRAPIHKRVQHSGALSSCEWCTTCEQCCTLLSIGMCPSVIRAPPPHHMEDFNF